MVNAVEQTAVLSRPNVLVLSHLNGGNRVFEDYCSGIRANSAGYEYVDYVREYQRFGKERFEAHVKQIVRDKRIDHIFFVWWSCDLTIDIRFIEALSSMASIVMNYFDTEYFFEGVDRYYAQLADVVMLPDCLSRYKYHQLGIEAITTFALYDKRLYARTLDAPRDIDVSFVGNLKQQSSRNEYLVYLQQHGVNVETFGIGSKHGFVDFEEMVRTFNRSKINLNFTMTSDRSNYVVNPPRISQRIKQSKGRPNEIALSGGFILSEYAPGIEEMYDIGREIDVFSTKEELLDKSRYYLSHAEQRDAMAARSHAKAMMHYEVVAGFAKVFARLATIERRRTSTIYVDPEFLDNFVSYRFVYIVCCALNGRLRSVLTELRILLRHGPVSLGKAYYFALKGFLLYMRDRPRAEQTLRQIKNRLRIRVKY